MTSMFHVGRDTLLDQAEERDGHDVSKADLDPNPGRATERVERLRVAISQNRDFAKSCDFNFRDQLLALANEMESYLRTLISPPSERELE